MSEKLRRVEEKLRGGARLEEVMEELSWRDFEEICAEIFEVNGYSPVLRGFRFKLGQRRFEVDVIAVRDWLAVCVDCKHWGIRPGRTSALRRAAEQHLERVRCLGEGLKMASVSLKLSVDKAVLIPAIVTVFDVPLIPSRGEVPIIPIFKFNRFTQEILSFYDFVAHISVELPRIC